MDFYIDEKNKELGRASLSQGAKARASCERDARGRGEGTCNLFFLKLARLAYSDVFLPDSLLISCLMRQVEVP